MEKISLVFFMLSLLGGIPKKVFPRTFTVYSRNISVYSRNISVHYQPSFDNERNEFNSETSIRRQHGNRDILKGPGNRDRKVLDVHIRPWQLMFHSSETATFPTQSAVPLDKQKDLDVTRDYKEDIGRKTGILQARSKISHHVHQIESNSNTALPALGDVRNSQSHAGQIGSLSNQRHYQQPSAETVDVSHPRAVNSPSFVKSRLKTNIHEIRPDYSVIRHQPNSNKFRGIRDQQLPGESFHVKTKSISLKDPFVQFENHLKENDVFSPSVDQEFRKNNSGHQLMYDLTRSHIKNAPKYMKAKYITKYHGNLSRYHGNQNASNGVFSPSALQVIRLAEKNLKAKMSNQQTFEKMRHSLEPTKHAIKPARLLPKWPLDVLAVQGQSQNGIPRYQQHQHKEYNQHMYELLNQETSKRLSSRTRLFSVEKLPRVTQNAMTASLRPLRRPDPTEVFPMPEQHSVNRFLSLKPRDIVPAK